MPNPTRRSHNLSTLLFLCLLAFGAIACGGEDTSPPDVRSEVEATSARDTPATVADPHDHSLPTASKSAIRDAKPKGEKAARNPNERPVPAFEGVTLAGTRLSMRGLLGARVLLFFFNPEVPNSTPVSEAVNALVPVAAAQNFSILGIGVGSNAATLSRFSKDQALGFPVIDDSGGHISQQLRLKAPIALLGVDADGFMSFGFASFPNDIDLRAHTDEELRKRMRLPAAVAEGTGALYAYPQAPDLGVVAMSSGKLLETEEIRGRAAIVIFFLHTCPHCHHALESIKGILAEIPEERKPRLVAISVQNSPGAIRKSLEELDLDFFDPYLDPSGKAAERWGVTGGVPVVTVVDSEGRIRHRSEGWNGQRDGGMLRMHATRAAGARVPMLLDPKG